jgi:FkbM family methyltransferase
MIKFLLIVILSILVGVHSTEKDGNYYYQEGLRLVREQRLDDAAKSFWGSLVGHQPEFPYTPTEALQNFLTCYDHQDKLALGYAHVAAQMHKMGDGRARAYLKQAYELEPSDRDILQLMAHMGETKETIKSNRKYSSQDETTTTDPQQSKKPHACRTRKECQKFIEEPNLSPLEAGWEDKVHRDYVYAQRRLFSTPKWKVTIPPLSEFEVAYDIFWRQFDDGKVGWEPETFKILHKYITKETTMIDIGTFFGPTIFFGAQLAKRCFGVEPDPVSFATVEHNLGQNAHLNETIYVHAVAVVAPEDAGYVQMETTKKGNSESMIVPALTGKKEEHFEAGGFTLPFLTTLWGIDIEKEPVFIKIDIEAYECRLLPSFHEWLKEEDVLNLTIFVSFHPHLKPCTEKQMQGVLETLKLFDSVSCKDHEKPLPIIGATTFEEFEAMLDDADCLTNRENSDFVMALARKLDRTEL